MSTSRRRFKYNVRSVRIQGATAAATATLHELARFARSLPPPASRRDWARLSAVARELSTVRPTEPLARNLSRWLVSELRNYATRGSSATAWRELVHHLECALAEYLGEANGLVVKAGERLVRRGQTIFTHCHSSLAEHVLADAHRAGKRFRVYHTETRPLLQGRITDKRLRKAHVPTVMVVDSAAAFLISNHSGDGVKVSWVLLGADSIARDGSVLNKIGSFGMALAAYDSRVPVYVAAPLLKVDWRGESTFELRSPKELWPHAPRGAKALNFAFDKVPARYMTGLITEFGVIKPSQVAGLVRKRYPWITTR